MSLNYVNVFKLLIINVVIGNDCLRSGLLHFFIDIIQLFMANIIILFMLLSIFLKEMTKNLLYVKNKRIITS